MQPDTKWTAGQELSMEAPNTALPFRPAQKRDTLPPEDLTVLVFDKPLLRRATTIQSFLSTSSKEDPFPGRYFEEPQPFFGDHDTLVGEIEGLHELESPHSVL